MIKPVSDPILNESAGASVIVALVMPVSLLSTRNVDPRGVESPADTESVTTNTPASPTARLETISPPSSLDQSLVPSLIDTAETFASAELKYAFLASAAIVVNPLSFPEYTQHLLNSTTSSFLPVLTCPITGTETRPVDISVMRASREVVKRHIGKSILRTKGILSHTAYRAILMAKVSN